MELTVQHRETLLDRFKTLLEEQNNLNKAYRKAHLEGDARQMAVIDVDLYIIRCQLDYIDKSIINNELMAY